jgi:Tol biopolymer transport system component
MKCQSDSDEIFFAVRSWEGEYFSRDIPGGVQTSPVRKAIYRIRVDNGALQQVPVENADNPGFSPDGMWLYFQADHAGHYRIYRCTPNGDRVVCIAPGAELGEAWKDAYGYALARDGRRMVYTIHDGATGRVVVANADGSTPRIIAPHLGYIYMAALDASGNRVVFSGPARDYRLLIMDLPDGNPRELTPDHPQSFMPRFAPDERTIVFLRRDGDIYSVATDGTNLRRLTHGNDYVEFKLSANDAHGSSDGPDISPDGERIAYIATTDGIPNVWMMNLDGSEQQQVTFRKSRCGRVRWSPDGQRLAFVSFENDLPQLFVADVASGETRQLTAIDGAVYFLAWKPVSSIPYS